MGPLAGLKIVEFEAVGPAPMAAMMLADLGASVLRIERVTPVEMGIKRPVRYNLTRRGRQAVALDLKSAGGREAALLLVDRADGLIEGFRPGVMERLGLGPEPCLQRNRRLAYGRMTGWGQEGPLAQSAAHDLNYIALTGALHAIGRKGQPPTPPLSLVGDLGGGAAYLAFGLVCAMLNAARSGEGQVVDAAIVDGVAHLMTNFHGLAAAGVMSERRGENIGDSGAFHYEVYECADGKWISIAPLETRFYAQFLERTGLSATDLPSPSDPEGWEKGKAVLARLFRQRTRAEWCAELEGTDACFAPVLSLSEAPDHPHMRARGVYATIDGVTQPAPAPRFSRTPSGTPTPPVEAGDVPVPDTIDGWLEGHERDRFLALTSNSVADLRK